MISLPTKTPELPENDFNRTLSEDSCMKLKWFVIACLFLSIAVPLAAQETFPHPLRPGERFRAPADVDTLFWVLKNTQYERALKNAISLRLADSTNGLLRGKITRLKAVTVEQDSIIADLRSGYDRYKEKWEACDRSLEESEVAAAKLRRRWIYTGVGGVAVGVVIGLLAN